MKKIIVASSIIVAVMMVLTIFSVANAENQTMAPTALNTSEMNVANFYPGSLIGIPEGYDIIATT